MLCAASGKGIHRPLKSKRDEAAGHQYRAKVCFRFALLMCIVAGHWCFFPLTD